jgi:hypothetical protein
MATSQTQQFLAQSGSEMNDQSWKQAGIQIGVLPGVQLNDQSGLKSGDQMSHVSGQSTTWAGDQ